MAEFHTLQVGEGWFPEQAGGLNRYYYDLLQALPTVDVQAQGLVLGSELVSTQTHGQVQTFGRTTDPLPQRLWAIRQAADQILQDPKLSLVVCHFALYAWPLLDRLGGRPLIIQFQGPWALEGQAEGSKAVVTALRALLERQVYQRGIRLIVLSEAFRDLLHRHYRIPLERIRVIPGGISVERFAAHPGRALSRSQLGWPADRPILLTVRRLVRRMGLESLIQAMVEVRRQVPEVLLWIAGKGALQAQLHQQIVALGLEETIRLLGFVPDLELPLLYAAADLTVVPTASLEGFGLVAAESLAAGTPALVTPVSSLPEVVRDLSPDLVLPGSDPAQIAEGLIMALQGKLALPDPGSAQDYVRARFGWPGVASRIRALYEEVLA